ncbi:hypothetical protein [Aeromonas molluscorum]|uniref:Transcriptional regulator n=1 Tax=Aeromonas molluscorum 848 TaxID=1268236 RepID=R1F2E0_9GAMM|nr:hypothetical protein [Aeromonas molluscorum]EOD54118.1 hypothetical protein G113_15983 [Aeromonas molluscorum 848]
MSNPNALPEWLVALQQAVKSSSLAVVAQRLGVSRTMVSQVCNQKYPGDLVRVKRLVEGAYLASTLICPILGEIRQDQCLAHQGRSNVSSNPLYIQVYKACRSGCPHSRIPEEKQLKRPIRLRTEGETVELYHAGRVISRLTFQAAGDEQVLVKLLSNELEHLAMRLNQLLKKQGEGK